MIGQNAAQMKNSKVSSEKDYSFPLLSPMSYARSKPVNRRGQVLPSSPEAGWHREL